MLNACMPNCMAQSNPLPCGRAVARSHESRNAAIDELMEYRNPTIPVSILKKFISERVKYEIETIWKKSMQRQRAL